MITHTALWVCWMFLSFAVRSQFSNAEEKSLLLWTFQADYDKVVKYQMKLIIFGTSLRWRDQFFSVEQLRRSAQG